MSSITRAGPVKSEDLPDFTLSVSGLSWTVGTGLEATARNDEVAYWAILKAVRPEPFSLAPASVAAEDQAWAQLTRNALTRWIRENPY